MLFKNNSRVCPPPRQANKIKVFGDIYKNIDNFKNILHNSDVLHLKLKK